MTTHDRPSALRPEILAARIFAALAVENESMAQPPATGGLLASRACDYAADFLREWRTRDPLTAEPNGLPADVELEVAGDSR